MIWADSSFYGDGNLLRDELDINNYAGFWDMNVLFEEGSTNSVKAGDICRTNCHTGLCLRELLICQFTK